MTSDPPKPPFPNGRVLETYINEDGREEARAEFETPGKVDVMYVGPNQAIPVIFLPGIMGSPLIATGANRGIRDNQGPWGWHPDDKSGWMLRCYRKMDAQQRKQLLNPAELRPVQPREAVAEYLEQNVNPRVLPVAEARRRGWGSVMISSYGKILNYLEMQLRYIYHQGHLYPGVESAARPGDPAAWGALKGYQRLSDAEFRQAAGWRYPVYAVGYNWADSNDAAARYLKRRVDEIRADCRDRLKLRCDRVILVTHSMGGLVGRRFAQLYPDDVLGVVHGVQPATGAGTAYARVRCGWESAGLSVTGNIGAWVLGPSGEEVMTVFANGAGPLELLPNQHYGHGWLSAEYGSGAARKTVLRLPQRNPYDEIYAEPNAWYRLVHPALLVSEGDRTNPEKVRKAWGLYIQQLERASQFHTQLSNYYHPVTYAHCGADGGQKAWYRVCWRLQPLVETTTGLRAREPSADDLRASELTWDDLKGLCTLRNPRTAGDVLINRQGVGVIRSSGGDAYRARLADQDSAGDATVPASSGLAPRPHAAFFAEMRGFEHQGSYDDAQVQAVTLYSVIRIALNAPGLPP
jgi:pimeloyl-ACP methyl ester carboxylesterase